ncbi:MAG: UDP-N-acetylmuramate:L-alanyl-gamma-D-glutamyl-meso-diaminopimelate ligase [Pseudomonadota bacterium]
MNIENNNPALPDQLLIELNRVPHELRRIHLMGICGTGMASLAGILKEKGYLATGSDQNVYPPMSTFLRDLSIPILEGYRAENLSPPPDLVIVGNVITRQNPEAAELSRIKTPYLSFPQALKYFAMAGKRSVVICGTHGKTTTSALAAWLLEKAGLDPSFMIGGLPHNFQRNFQSGTGPYFVIEGDEYDTAFFDKGPKFLHYSPWATILTSIEFDHADIYRDLDHIKESFRKLIDLIPAEGLLISNGDDPLVIRQSKRAKSPVTTYGFSENADWRGVDVDVREESTHLRILKKGKPHITLSTPLYGRHNIGNLLSIVALSDFLEIDGKILAEAMKGFMGIRRRQEVRGEKKGILILDDFAHHPTAVRETLLAVKEKYVNRRLIAVFEPRSNSSRRNVFQGAYAAAFDNAELVFIPEPPLMEKIPPEERFSSAKLVEDLKKRGLKAIYAPDTDHLIHEILRSAREGDVILIMSNGSFDDLHDKLLNRLDEFLT